MRLKKVLIIILFCFILIDKSFAVSSHNYYKRYFTTINKNANIVEIDMNNKNINVDVIRANNKINNSMDMLEMIKRENKIKNNVFAAINGTYFSAYDNLPLPYGNIIDDKKLIHIGNYGCTIGFTKENKIIMDNLKVNLKGYINGNEQFYAWGINHPRSETDAIVIYSNEYVDNINSLNAKSVIVKDNKVINIVENVENISIPKNGFIIVFNSNIKYLVERFSIGDEVEYKAEYLSKNIDKKEANAINWTDIEYALGAGPSLIIDGKITANPKEEGFFEDKININRAQRSFIGVTKENKVILGTIKNITIIELAQICLELKLENAMCLDGGASSGLYYKDKFITKPGRKLNNILIFKYL